MKPMTGETKTCFQQSISDVCADTRSMNCKSVAVFHRRRRCRPTGADALAWVGPGEAVVEIAPDGDRSRSTPFLCRASCKLAEFGEVMVCLCCGEPQPRIPGLPTLSGAVIILPVKEIIPSAPERGCRLGFVNPCRVAPCSELPFCCFGLSRNGSTMGQIKPG